ncbi:MAG: pilus assembly protein PilM [Myxococcales bacterium]|nr:pilus assembly protein PilM [Myxococcales bacterium]
MPLMKSILGLDVGSHSIKAVELHQSMRGLQGGQMRLHPRADYTNTDELSQDLQHFVQFHHLETEHVVSAISGEQISLRRLEFPFREKKKLAAAVPFAVEGEIPFELDDVVIDWTPIGGDAGKSDVLAALTHRDNVSSHLSLFQAAGIEPRILEAEGLVLGNLAGLFDLSGNRLLLDLGHTKTTMCLMVDDRAINACTIPLGGLAFTRALAEARGCSLEEAEQIKCAEGVGLPPVPEAAAVLSRICREIVRFLESNRGHTVSEAEPAGITEITMMGGTSKLIGIADLIYDQIGIGAYPLSEPEDDEQAEMIANGDPVLFAPSIALALRASSLALTQLNFRQDEFAYRTNFLQILSQDLRPTAILAAIAAALATISFGTSLALESSRAHSLELRAQQLYAEVMPGGPVKNPVPALSQALREAQDRSDFLGIYSTDLSAVDLLAELSRRIPADVKVQFEDININRRVVKIKVLGESYETADRLKSLLAKSAPFASAEVDKVKSTRGGSSKRFNLTLKLVSDGESS